MMHNVFTPEYVCFYGMHVLFKKKKSTRVSVSVDSPAPELVGLRDVGVDHEGAAERGGQRTTAKVRQLGPFDGHDGLSGAIEVLRLGVAGGM